MLDFIPVKYYYLIYIHLILFTCIVTYFHTIVLAPNETKTLTFNRLAAPTLLITLLLFLGLRPINGVFVDMTTYAHIFERYRLGNYSIDSDYGFSYFILFCTKFLTIEWFFFLCECIYIVTIYVACKKWFPNHYFFAFLLFIASFSFWTYGVNGIRNGMATSLFVLGIAFNGKNFKMMVAFLLISVSFHTSMTLPVLAFATTYFVTDTKKYLFFYVLAIALSITMGGIWENIFASMGFGDERLSQYLTKEADSSKFTSTGFRYDFLIYSLAPIILGCHYKLKKGFNDILYDRILHTYIVANGFWVMVIRANYTNRFAYLSWFLMAAVIIYPVLKANLWENQFKKIGVIILCYFGFTYLMYAYYNIL